MLERLILSELETRVGELEMLYEKEYPWPLQEALHLGNVSLVQAAVSQVRQWLEAGEQGRHFHDYHGKTRI